MATVTGLTAERMLVIEGESIVDGEVVGDDLILTKHNGEQIIAGPVIGPQGLQGAAGPAGGLIPGEIRLWPGGTLPELANYGKWVWADGTAYDSATYPIAASHIATAWKTFGGASDPGAGKFRVPDLRGLVPAGLDAMPGGSRANRMTRSVAIILAGKTGEETHVITLPESPSHYHGVNDPLHSHGVNDPTHSHGENYTYAGSGSDSVYGHIDAQYRQFVGGHANAAGDIQAGSTGISIQNHATGISIQNAGGGGAHENVQPTVFVPYIVKLDG